MNRKKRRIFAVIFALTAAIAADIIIFIDMRMTGSNTGVVHLTVDGQAQVIDNVELT